MTTNLDWAAASIDVSSVPEDGARWSLAADNLARVAVAQRLQVDAVQALHASFDLKPLTGGGLRARGKIDASLARICVVTDKPFIEQVADSFVFRILDDDAALPANPHPDDPDMEVAADGKIDLSEVTIQQLSVAMAAYPRGPEADREMAEIETALAHSDADSGTQSSPFSTLAARLRPDSAGKDEK